jgi:transcriptional regulator of heat shock response
MWQMEPIVEQAVPIMQRHALILQLVVEEYLDEGEPLNTLSVKKL